MRRNWSFAIIAASLAAGCASSPHYPTEKQWKRTPIFRRDQKTIEIQGNFKNDITKFLLASSKVVDGLTKEEVEKLGFDPNLKDHPCESIGWLETSRMVLNSAEIKHSNIDEAIKSRKPYSAIRCQAKDIKIRTDRLFTYINNKDTYAEGESITLTIIFKKEIKGNGEYGLDKVVGVDRNGKPIKNHERQSSVLQIMGELIGVPKINIDIRKYLPAP